MKNRIAFFALLITLQSCDSESKKQQQVQSGKILESQSAPIKENKIIQPVHINIDEIPSEIKYEGKIKNAVRWTDQLGDHIVMTSETGIYRSKKFTHESDGGDAEIFAYHFIASNGIFKQKWRVYDFISDCPVDIVAEFVDKTFQITDLDDNGIAEIWLMYKTVCHGDVSPSDMKIIMYEGQQKFAIRGETTVMYGIDDKGQKMYEGSDYKIDDAFTKGPTVFLEFAKKLWAKHIVKT